MAVQNPTQHFGWTLPNVGADVGAWGSILNTIFGENGVSGPPGIDAILGDVKDLAEAALPGAGGQIGGDLVVDGDVELNGDDTQVKSLTVRDHLQVDSTSISLGAGNNNDVGPGNVPMLQLTGASGGSNITGLAGGGSGRFLVVFISASGGGAVNLVSNSTASSTANRIQVPGAALGASVPLTDLPRAVMFIHTGSRWRPVSPL